MATSVGLLRLRGKSQGAQLLLGQLRSTQRHGVAKSDCTSSKGGYGLAVLRARRLSSSAGNTDKCGDVHVHCSCNVPGVVNAVVGTMALRRTSRPRLLLKTSRGLSSTASRPSRDFRQRKEGADAMSGARQDLSFKESRYDLALGCYPWEKEQDQQSESDDGDLVSAGCRCVFPSQASTLYDMIACSWKQHALLKGYIPSCLGTCLFIGCRDGSAVVQQSSGCLWSCVHIIVYVKGESITMRRFEVLRRCMCSRVSGCLPLALTVITCLSVELMDWSSTTVCCSTWASHPIV